MTQVQIHGHRGARGRRPENSLQGIREAIRCGADAVEVDLCVTADDQVVLHHDLGLSSELARAEANQWIDEPIAIRLLPLDQLQQFEVGRIRPGNAYHERFKSQVGSDGVHIPTLAQMIQLICEEATGEFIFNLELKSDPGQPALTPNPDRYVDLVLDILRTHNIHHRVFLQSFDWKLVRLARQRMPSLLCGCLTDLQPDAAPEIPDQSGDGLWTDGMILNDFDGSVPQMVRAADADVWSSNFLDLTPELVAEAHDLGLKVYVWTVNERKDMLRMIDFGVDAITTDYPDVLVGLRNELGCRT